MGNIFAYCRISRKEQSIDRQVRNIAAAYPDAIFYKEAYTGTKMDRPAWNRLYTRVSSGDRIVFDSVSRMSRTAEEGIATYMDLYQKGVKLSFLKEPYIDTEVYDLARQNSIAPVGNDIADIYIEATNKVIALLAQKQISAAFAQAEKEVTDLHQRTKEGIETARLNGKQIGQKPGKKLIIKKEGPAKELMRKHCKDFGGTLTDKEVMALTKLSRNTFYKYKKELL